MGANLTPSQTKALHRLAALVEPASAGKLAGVPPGERADALAALITSGLAAVVAPSGRARLPRYAITEEGRRVVATLPPPRLKPTGRVTAAALAARLDELERRLGEVEKRLAPPPGPADLPAGPADMSYEVFRTAAREAHRRLDEGARTLGLVPIPDLRRALGGRLARHLFDEHLLRLHKDGLVHLMPHDHPTSLPDDRQRDCLTHPTAGLLYFVRWLEP